MSGPRDPWADPSTPTEQGAPYAGPPATVPVVPYGYAPPVWGQPYPGPWTSPPPRGPQRPAQVITAAVLAFVQAALVLIASLYLRMFARILDFFATETTYDAGRAGSLTREGTALAVVGLLSAVLLVGAGVWALNARRSGAWWLLLSAHAIQVVLTVYWLVRLLALVDASARSSIAGLALFFGAGPLTALVLLLVGAGRRWFLDRA
jgi:hypothetical protein